jgi:hypothetical protein
MVRREMRIELLPRFGADGFAAVAVTSLDALRHTPYEMKRVGAFHELK